jgi:hypothetical protein
MYIRTYCHQYSTAPPNKLGAEQKPAVATLSLLDGRYTAAARTIFQVFIVSWYIVAILDCVILHHRKDKAATLEGENEAIGQTKT